MTRQELQSQLDALTAFCASPVYARIVQGWNIELSGLEAAILQVAPTTPEVVAQLNQNYGKRESLLAQLDHFETLRDRLKTELAKIGETDIIVAPEPDI